VENLSELLTTHVHKQPDRIAVATSDLRTVISYRQLDTLVGRLRRSYSQWE
jgi:non-ribosomal peptide synthetase component E (peptide arylation enzyme)